MASALLIIDPQVGWQHEAVADAFKNSLDFAKSFKNTVLLSTYKNQPDSRFVSQLNWSRFTTETDQALLPGFDELQAQTFSHETYSCMTPELSTFLTDNNIDSIYLAGVFTDVCISMTAMELFDSNIEVFVLTDLVGTLHGEDVHQASLKSLRHILGNSHVLPSTQL